MIEFLIANMAPSCSFRLVVFLVIGYPVAFSLGANGLFFGLIAIELGLLQPALFQALPERVFGIMFNETLLAIPFFTFMGLILERSGMAEELLDTIGQLFGSMRGGLAYAVIFVGALLAATTGVVAASVISMGLISLPIMMRYGYDHRLAAGVIAASGTLAQIIPPSLVLIVLADQLGRSVGDMYAGALIPGLLLTGMYALYVFVYSMLKPGAAPALPPEARTLRGAALAWRVATTMVPPLVLIFLVLGTFSLASPRRPKAARWGPTGALVLALARRRLGLPVLTQAMDKTAKLTCFAIFILVGSTVFGLVFRGVNGDLWVEHLLVGLPGGQLGFPAGGQPDGVPAGILPRFFRTGLHHRSAAGAGGGQAGDRPDLVRRHPGGEHADLVHASTVRLRAVLSRSSRARLCKTSDIYRGAIPFVLLQLAMVVGVISFPSLVTGNLEKHENVDIKSIRIEVPRQEEGSGAYPGADPSAYPGSGRRTRSRQDV